MKDLSTSLAFLLSMAKVQTLLTRKFDSSLGGISYTEFMILYQLSIAPDQKLKRIDLANKVGLTASGITRLLLPMEKIGLVAKEVNERDARVSFVLLASGGKKKLEEGLERAELLASELIPESKAESIKAFNQLLQEMKGTIN